MSIEVGMQVKRRGRPPKETVVKNYVDVKFDDIELKMAHWAYRLELAASMRAGAMDSENRHCEVAETMRTIVMSVVEEMRKC